MLNFSLRKSESESPQLNALKLDFNKTRSADVKSQYINFCDEESDDSLPEKTTSTPAFLLENLENSKITIEEHMKRMSEQYNLMVLHV